MCARAAGAPAAAAESEPYSTDATLGPLVQRAAPTSRDEVTVDRALFNRSNLRGHSRPSRDGRVIMTDKKVVFVAFAIEDERMRDLFKGQSLHPRHPYEFIDMSVKKPYDTEWKEKVRTRIRRSDGIVALVSKNSLTSSGQKWEIQCAKEEGKKIRGIWIYSNDRTALAGVQTVEWTDANVANFIDSL